MDKFLFLDRDDTVIINIPYLSDPSKVVLTPGAGPALSRLIRAGYHLALTTNQSGIGRGLFTREDMERVNARISELLAPDGVRFDAIYFCPHAPDTECNCRKPKTGMLTQACRDFHVDRENSFVIGDSQGDIQMGKSFGLRTIQIRLSGRDKPDFSANFLASTLNEAADFILKKCP